MAMSEKKVKQLIAKNPHSLTPYEISGNDRAKAIELLQKLKERELLINKKKEDETNK
jgi:hypothetical protein